MAIIILKLVVVNMPEFLCGYKSFSLRVELEVQAKLFPNLERGHSFLNGPKKIGSHKPERRGYYQDSLRIYQVKPIYKLTLFSL